MKLIKAHADHHGSARSLSSLAGIVLHETEGYNGGDYSTLRHGGPRGVSVHFWVPDYNDAGCTYKPGDVVQFLALTTTGNSVGQARSPFTNARTISIELGNYKSEAYSEGQLKALDELIAHLDAEVGRKLPLVSHAEIALPRGRKTDPGRTFPMAAYRKWRAHTAPPAVKPKPAPKPKPLATIRSGSRNAALVKKLQRALTSAHYKGADGHLLDPDGVFGKNTLHAVKDFQRAHKMLASGICGPKTWEALGL